jgi:predicted nucleotidyltransferase
MEANLIEKLKEYFNQRKDIAFAFLYGSQAKGGANKLSDVDVAVYFYPPEPHPIEFEKEVYYDGENEIWGDLQGLLKKEVELLALNRVSASVAASAIRGIPLLIKDWGLYLDFMEIITAVSEDFTESVINDYMERSDIEKRESGKTY